MRDERIIRQLPAMVKAGRVTEEEAERLRATQGTAAFEEALAAVRTRHAGERLQVAVAQGEMTPEEAAGYLTRLGAGEHPKGLRARLRRHRQSGRH